MQHVNRHHIPHHILLTIVLIIICASADSLWAIQNVEIAVAASAEEIFVGESIDYLVEIQNSENPSAPDMSAIKVLFDVEAAGDESRNQSSTIIRNGRMTQRSSFGHIYRFRLTPKQAGELTIPPATATIDGSELISEKISLRVIAPEPQDLVVVETVIDQARIYPTQPFTVTFRVLVRPIPSENGIEPLRPLRQNPPHVQLNWVDTPTGLEASDKMEFLQATLAGNGIGFTLNDVAVNTGSFFDGQRAAVFNWAKGRESRNGLDGTPISYFKYELARTFRANQAGTFSFGPAIVKGTFVSALQGSKYQAKRLVVIAPAATVEVREVPSPRPSTFCGGIGTYKWTTSASPTTLRTGDPITLTLEVEQGPNSGSLAMISAPNFSSNEQLTNDFELIDTEPTGRVDGSVKKFSYAMRPKRANVNLPELSITTFDPVTEQFSNVDLASIKLDVTESARLSGSELVGSLSTSSATEIKTRSEGIFQNITDPTLVSDEQIHWSTWGQIVAGCWLIVGGLVTMITVQRRKSTDVVWQRRQHARRNANRRIADAKNALARGETKEALRTVRSAILSLIGDTRNLVSDGLTMSDVSSALSAASIPATDQSTLVTLLESIEATEFGAGQNEDPVATIASASAWIARVAPRLERGA